ncbi:DapH/DapD/GlmU-related protein [Methanococcoides methylutens]|nr:acyltransferase [Methanococcoides methylutens]
MEDSFTSIQSSRFCDNASHFKRIGKNVTIYSSSKIVKKEVIEISDNSMIDDFTFIYGGDGISIGKFVHIASFVSVTGGGKLTMGDYSVLSCGVRVLTGSDTYHGGKRMTSALPIEQRNVVKGSVVIGKDAFIGANSVIHPDVSIGEGAVIGSNSLVLNDVDPWSINVGSPCKKIGVRDKILDSI